MKQNFVPALVVVVLEAVDVRVADRHAEVIEIFEGLEKRVQGREVI